MIIPYSCKVKLLNKAYKTQANATICPYTCMFEKSPKQHFENTTLCDESVYNSYHEKNGLQKLHSNVTAFDGML